MNVRELQAILDGIEPVFKAMRTEIAELRAKAQGIPEEPAGSALTSQAIQSMIDTAVGAALAALPDPQPGPKGDAGTNGVDGTSVTMADVQPWIAEEIGRQLSMIQQERAAITDFVKSVQEGIARELGALTSGS